jgi:hypothetical protein
MTMFILRDRKVHKPYANKGRSQPDRIERFLSRFDRSAGLDACWPWLGSCSHGYGSISWQGRTIRTHVLVFILANGVVPSHFDLQVLHTCDNPPCGNPKHLWLGAHLDNMSDKAAKGRSAGGGGVSGSLRTTLSVSIVSDILSLCRVVDLGVVQGRSVIRYEGIKPSALADKFGVSSRAVIHVLRHAQTFSQLHKKSIQS